MATIRKRSGNWEVRIRKQGVSLFATFASKKLAQQFAEEKEKQIEQGKLNPLYSYDYNQSLYENIKRKITALEQEISNLHEQQDSLTSVMQKDDIDSLHPKNLTELKKLSKMHREILHLTKKFK